MPKELSDSDKKVRKVAIAVLIIIVILIGLPTFEFLKDGALLFGKYAFLKVLLLSSIGGALSTSICTKRRKQRLMAILPGALMGIGVPLSLTSYVFLLHRGMLFGFECVLPIMIGVFPGFLLYVALVKDIPSEN